MLNINALWPVGVDDPVSGNSESFVVMQNAPNPFRGTTLVRIFLKKEGELNLAVLDNQGKPLSEYHNGLEKGWHLLGISASGSRLWNPLPDTDDLINTFLFFKKIILYFLYKSTPMPLSFPNAGDTAGICARKSPNSQNTISMITGSGMP